MEGTSHDRTLPLGAPVTDKTATWVIGVVTAVWAANIVLGMAQINDYQPSEAVNGIFMTIVGGAFALRARARNGNNGGDDK